MKKITAQELRNKWIEFFKTKNHTIIPSASLVPENDPSVLFTMAGGKNILVVIGLLTYKNVSAQSISMKWVIILT